MTAITLETIKARQDELAAMIAEFNANKSRTITLTVNGREWVLPEPLRVKPAHDEAVWILSIESWPITWGWYDCKAQNAALAAGQLYATKDDCQAWAEFDKCCRGGGV